MVDLKTKLLATNLFIDNSYLNEYIKLIIINLATKKMQFMTNRHHILPVKYFNMLNLPIDNSLENVVNLAYKDHILAHYYLCNCTIADLRNANIKALVALVNKNFSEINEEWLVQNLPTFQNIYSEQKQLVSAKMKTIPHKGYKHTPETNKKISEAHIGKSMSEEAKQKMRQNHYNCTGTNNPASGRHWYNNGIERLYLKDGDTIPDGFVRGNLPLTEEDKQKKSKSNKGKHGYIKGSIWYNNGVIEIMSKNPPINFVKGRLKK